MKNIEIEDMLNGIPDEDKVCGNCIHWGWGTLRGVERPYGTVGYRMAYPCKREDLSRIEPDVRGPFVIMLSETCSCAGHGDAFDPSEDYIATRAEELAVHRDHYE